MKRYVCYIGTKGLTESSAAVLFQATKEEVQAQWNTTADDSTLIFIKDPTSSRTELLGLPD